MKTYSPKPKDITRSWYVLDASEAALGRVAAKAAKRYCLVKISQVLRIILIAVITLSLSIPTNWSSPGIRSQVKYTIAIAVIRVTLNPRLWLTC